jgi:hypothetical protein
MKNNHFVLFLRTVIRPLNSNPQFELLEVELDTSLVKNCGSGSEKMFGMPKKSAKHGSLSKADDHHWSNDGRDKARNEADWKMFWRNITNTEACFKTVFLAKWRLGSDCLG